MIVVSTRIVSRTYASLAYLWSAQHHARLAQDIENARAGTDVFSIRHRAYVVAAITNAVAFMESSVNEVIQDAAELRTDHIKGLNSLTLDRLHGYWLRADRTSVLAKYDDVLHMADQPRFLKDRSPYAPAQTLISIRNYFIHYKPEDIEISATADPHRFEKQLRQAFPENALMRGTAGNPWFPDRMLGAGCAHWAHTTARELVDSWSRAVNLTDLPYMVATYDEAP